MLTHTLLKTGLKALTLVIWVSGLVGCSAILPTATVAPLPTVMPPPATEPDQISCTVCAEDYAATQIIAHIGEGSFGTLKWMSDGTLLIAKVNTDGQCELEYYSYP